MRSLAAACEHALVAGARAARAGSRQQRRAAARRFVRRHRRDAGYLRWVLGSVGASSALAVALLGLGAEPAHAKASRWGGGSGFPMTVGPSTSYRGPAPVWGDLDGDGDLDLVLGDAESFRYLENTGSATSPALVERTGAQNPLDSPGVYVDRAALGDLDGDGDLDLVAAYKNGDFYYFENTGSAASPGFVLRTGAQSPVEGVSYFSYPNLALADLDSDGDLDLTVASAAFRYFENTGTASMPAFVERTGQDNPVLPASSGSDADMLAAPSFGDLDEDGDLDLVLGRYGGWYGLRYLENTGSATHPAMIERTGASNPLAFLGGYLNTKPALGDLDGDSDLDILTGMSHFDEYEYLENRAGRFVRGFDYVFGSVDVGMRSKAAFGDLDADGDLDLVVGESGGSFRYFENTGAAADPVYVQRTGAANPLDGRSAGADAAPALGDLDADGDLDLVAGMSGGGFRYFENTGNEQSPAFTAGVVATGPLAGLDVGDDSAPALGDVDGDGDLDLLAGEYGGAFLYFENTGSAESPAFIARTGAGNPLDGANVGALSAPSLGDFDGDGDLDLVAGADTTFLYFENTGSAATPAFAPRTGAANPLDGEPVEGRAAPARADFDGDGDLDLVAGEVYGELRAFANAIVKPVGSIFELSGGANPLDGQSADAFSTPALGDLDGDGDLDLVSGENLGTFACFENTGSATSPRFGARTGAANPFDGLSVGALYSTPSLGDLDADGDLDLVAGSYTGTFAYFENTGSVTSPAFVARTGAQNSLDGQNAGSPRSAPALGDLDADGDLDLTAGSYAGSFRYFENTGSATSPAFVLRTGAQNPLDGQDVGNTSTPVLGDVDGDGDLDLFAGNYIGTIDYFENTGSATSPAFVPRPGSFVPLQDYVWTPALGDLDADGDLDVVAGDVAGTFRTFYVPEPAQGLLLGAGLALLSLLERLRGRRAPAPGRSASEQIPIRASGR